MCVCLCVCLPVCMCLCQCLCVSAYLYVCMSVCLCVLLENSMGWGWDESHQEEGRQAGWRAKGELGQDPSVPCQQLQTCAGLSLSQSPGNWSQTFLPYLGPPTRTRRDLLAEDQEETKLLGQVVTQHTEPQRARVQKWRMIVPGCLQWFLALRDLRLGSSH